MWLLSFALRRYITIFVAVLSSLIASSTAIKEMHLDIFPNLGVPLIYVAQPYGGLSPLQMEGYISSWYEFMFMYATGVKSIESRSVESFTLVKLEFYPGTNMAQAMAETEALVTRALAFMPPGVEPPFILRFDAGSLPVGNIVLRSPSRTINELQDMAMYKVRPKFAALAGVSAPTPFGGNQRTIVFHANADKLRAYQISPDQVVQGLVTGNFIAPAGLVRIKDMAYLAPNNGVPANIKDIENIVIMNERGANISMRDLGWVEDSADILVGYALVDGVRVIYIPVTKRADASTWTVVQEVKKNLPSFQTTVPEDVKVTYEFDQSGLVKNSLLDVAREGLLGALLTGLMVYLFLRDVKSALIVIFTIPISLMTSLLCLWFAGQTINIMTLMGLALSVGVLVDESTVVVENMHTHIEKGKTTARAVVDSGREIILIRFIILICILAVFIPIFFTGGMPHALFTPLALAVSFAMIASYLLSQTFVPILAIKWLKNAGSPKTSAKFQAFKEKYEHFLKNLLISRGIIIFIYCLVCTIAAGLIFKTLGVELYPAIHNGMFKMRIDAPVGTRVETTELVVRRLLDVIHEVAGNDNIRKSLAFIGNQPPTYAINIIYIWTSGPHEAVIDVELKKSKVDLEALKEKLRDTIAERFKDISISFEPAGLIEQVLSLGALTPVEIIISGNSLADNASYAEKLKNELAKIKNIRDLRYGEAHDYPSLRIDVDRITAGQLGVTVEDVYKAVTPAVYSTRFPVLNYWVDTASGIAYQVQVEIPQFQIQTVEDVKGVPIIQKNRNTINIDQTPDDPYISYGTLGVPPAQNSNRSEGPYVRDLANVEFSKEWGEPHRINLQRIYSLTANIHGNDLLSLSHEIEKAVNRAGDKPRGLSINIRSQIKLLLETMDALKISLVMSMVAILLLLAATFQSFMLALVSLSAIPIVLVGSGLALLLTGSTLNIQSYLGTIMAIGVSVSNAILLVTMAEELRKISKDSTKSALEGGSKRLRPILMTAIAMIVGLLPMALAIGSSGSQSAPLARAVIGGMIASLFGTLFIVPLMFSFVRQKASVASDSLDPDDKTSEFYEKK